MTVNETETAVTDIATDTHGQSAQVFANADLAEAADSAQDLSKSL